MAVALLAVGTLVAAADGATARPEVRFDFPEIVHSVPTRDDGIDEVAWETVEDICHIVLPQKC